MLTLRHATAAEKHQTYAWMCLSDTASLHMGESDFPENPVPTWERFDTDFPAFYYEPGSRDRGSVLIIENDGEAIGCLCYACFHLRPRRAELDIWLKERRLCGQGYGSAALQLLVGYLHTSFAVQDFIIRPAERNRRAIRSYEKAGFRIRNNKQQAVEQFLTEEFRQEYGGGDYGMAATAVLTLHLSGNGDAEVSSKNSDTPCLF